MSYGSPFEKSKRGPKGPKVTIFCLKIIFYELGGPFKRAESHISLIETYFLVYLRPERSLADRRCACDFAKM